MKKAAACHPDTIRGALGVAFLCWGIGLLAGCAWALIALGAVLVKLSSSGARK